MSDYIKSLLAVRQKERMMVEFADMPDHKLLGMSPKELAAWQAKHPSDSAQYLLATHEWNRRLIVAQVRWMKFSVIIGFIGVIVGVLLTSWLQSAPSAKDDSRASKQAPKEDLQKVIDKPGVQAPPIPAEKKEPNQPPQPTR